MGGNDGSRARDDTRIPDAAMARARPAGVVKDSSW
jgi:hypothetical protein